MPVIQKIKTRGETKRSCGGIAKHGSECSSAKRDLCRMMYKMSLNELLEASAYIDKLIHGETVQLPGTGAAGVFVTQMLQLKKPTDMAEIISKLNEQIITKNRSTVNPESAERAYIAFISAE